MSEQQQEPRGPGGSGSAPQIAANNELFVSDSFRMYCMKVLPCSKRFVHDWPSCPFAHPDEKAKRRDPRTHDYDCEMCPAVVKGEVCELGAACPHSHHVFEAWLHPLKYRTLLCKDRDQCDREVCFFAHGPQELRTPERGFQPRLAQQRGTPSAGTYHAAASNRSRSAASYLPHHQHQAPRPGMVAGSVSSGFSGSSSSSNASSTMQLHSMGFAACQGFPAAGGAPMWQQQSAASSSATLPNILSEAGVASQLQAGVAGAGPGGSLSQLLQQLAAEASASRHEAAEHTRAAAAAEEKLHLLEQLVSCGSSMRMLPGVPAAGAASPHAVGQAATPLDSWQGSPQAARAVKQLQLQQLLLSGADDGLYPRRHSCDEALLRRMKELPPGGGFANAGISGSMQAAQHLWDAGQAGSRTMLMQQQQPLPEQSPGSAASADIQALAAAFAAASTAPNLDMQQAAALGSMQAHGLPNVALLTPAGTPSGAAGLCARSNNSGWLAAAPGPADAFALTMSGNKWAGGMAPLGLFNSSLPALPSIPSSAQAQMPDSLSLSASHLQQHNYLLQLQGALPAGGSVARSPSIAAVQPGRASYDAGAAYMMCEVLPGGAVMAQGAADVLQAQGAGCASTCNVNGNSGASNAQLDGAAAAAHMPDQLAMGWF